jgi:predicted dehydrogenase
MKDLIDSGTIGEIKVVWVRHFVPRGGDWYYHDWHANSKQSTGLLLQKASHDIDMIHWLTGRYTVKVAAFGGLDYYGGDKTNDLRCDECESKDDCVEYQYVERPGNKRNMCVFRKEVDVEDNNTVMMLLAGGIKATYMQCHFAPEGQSRNYCLIGTEGMIESGTPSGKIRVRLRNRSRRWKNLADYEIDVKKAAGGHGGADPVITTDFLDMIMTGKMPVSTPLAGRMSVAAGCAATASLRNGWGAIDIPAVPDDIREKVF